MTLDEIAERIEQMSAIEAKQEGVAFVLDHFPAARGIMVNRRTLARLLVAFRDSILKDPTIAAPLKRKPMAYDEVYEEALRLAPEPGMTVKLRSLVNVNARRAGRALERRGGFKTFHAIDKGHVALFVRRL